MKICLVLETGGGGAGRHVLDLARELPRRGHSVTVIYSPVRAEARFLRELHGLPIKIVPIELHRRPGLRDLKAAAMLSATLKRHGRFDVVHGHSAKAGALVRMVPRRGAALVYTPHAFRGLDPDAPMALRMAVNLAEAALGAVRTDALIAVSRDELAFAERWGIARGRRQLIGNGVIHPRPGERSAVRRQLGFSDDHVLMGFVGRLSYQKAPERFVAVAGRVMRQRAEARAVIIGDGEMAGTVQAAIAASGFSERFVHLTSADAQDYVCGFDLMVMTSRYEGLSYVMLESLAAGVPIVSTAVAGARDLIEHGREGLIIEGPDPVRRLSEAVAELVSDAAARTAMGSAARERGRRINGSRMIDETEALYRRLLTKKAA